MCNAITLTNLFCGIAAIASVINGRYVLASWLIIGAAGLDMLDGKIARIFKMSSNLGKYLDSSADLVSFGVAPFVLVYVINFQIPIIALFLLSVYLMCGAFRLAKFNTLSDNDSKICFQGLPITVAGASIASATLVLHKISFESGSYIILLITIVLALLMISKIKYPIFNPEKIE